MPNETHLDHSLLTDNRRMCIINTRTIQLLNLMILYFSKYISELTLSNLIPVRVTENPYFKNTKLYYFIKKNTGTQSIIHENLYIRKIAEN